MYNNASIFFINLPWRRELKMYKPEVLLIDDDPGYLDSLSLALEGEFHVHAASNCSDVLKIMLDAASLSLILLDLHMPEMNGIQFLQKIRDANDKIPVLILTGKGRCDWVRRCWELGVEGYMDKLAGIEELIGKMKNCLVSRV